MRVWQTFATGPDRRVAILLEHELVGRLLVETITDDTFVCEVALGVQVGGGGRLQLSVDDRRATLLLVEPAINAVFGMHVTFDGAVARFMIPAVTMPERMRGAWLTQVSDGGVMLCDERGTALSHWNIADEAHHGVGELVVVGGAPYFVLPHREALVSLEDGKVVSRKLAPKEQSVRRFYTSKITRYNRAGAPFGLAFSLGRVSYWNKDTQVSASFTMSAGDGSLGANIIRTALYGECNDGDTRALAPFTKGGTGSGMHSEALVEPVSLASLKKLAEVCDRERVWLPFASSWIKDLYERRMGKGSSYYGEPSAPPGDLAAERALFRALLAHCADPSVPPIAPEIDRWLGELSADEALTLLTRFDDKAPMMPCRAYEAIAWMTLRVLSAPDAARVLVWMLLDGSESQLNNAAHNAGQALAALLAQHPALRDSTVERVRAHGPVPRVWGGDRRDELLNALTGAGQQAQG